MSTIIHTRQHVSSPYFAGCSGAGGFGAGFGFGVGLSLPIAVSSLRSQSLFRNLGDLVAPFPIRCSVCVTAKFLLLLLRCELQPAFRASAPVKGLTFGTERCRDGLERKGTAFKQGLLFLGTQGLWAAH